MQKAREEEERLARERERLQMEKEEREREDQRIQDMAGRGLGKAEEGSKVGC